MPDYDLTLSAAADARLTLMARAMGEDRSGAIRKAMVLLEIALREGRKGNALGVVNGDRVVYEITGIVAGGEE